MKWILCRSCIVTAAALVLPGCLAINAVLGVMGYLATGPGQLLGTAYTVSEYTYEYAVNDKTPDEVIVEKFDWLLLPEEDPAITGYAKAFRKSVLSPPMADIDPEVKLAESSLGTSKAITLAPKKQKTPPTMAASLHLPKKKAAAAKPQRVRRQQPKVKRSSPVDLPVVTAEQSKPRHQYVERETDPLLTRLDRLEQTFRQAETMALIDSGNGVLLSVQSDGNAPAKQGISGTWSIRHKIMEYGPSPPPLGGMTEASQMGSSEPASS